MQAGGLIEIPGAGGRMADTRLYGFLFAGAVIAFCFQKLLGSQLGAASILFAIVGNATCGWSWLLTRALFQSPGTERQSWPFALVLGMVILGALTQIGDGSEPLLRIAGNVVGLISSALLIMAMVEPLKELRGPIAYEERRFRLIFAGGYALLLATAIIWVNGAPAGSMAAESGTSIKIACALAALIGLGLAIHYRAAHPMRTAVRERRHTAAAGDERLAERLLHLLREEAAFTQSELRVADLARLVGEAEYKVTMCVTGALGFRNFNHMTNHFRVAEAKRRLASPDFAHLPILTIALDCGFGSIGPFNRAFKAETGMIPTHFRNTQAKSDIPQP